jgi:hypothetical protein
MPLTLTSTFDPTKTVNSRRQRVDFTPTGGSIVKISCKVLDVDSKLTTSILKQPGTDDLIRDVAEVAVEAEETITLVDIEEIDAVLSALTGLNGLVLGVAKAYVKDPRDASAAVVRYSITGAAGATFACSLRRPDGAVKFGGNDYSKTSLLLRNLSGAKLVFNIGAASPDGSA